MKSENLLSFLIFLAFIVSGTACAGDQGFGKSFRATADRFSYSRDQREINIPLKPTMNDWVVNCDRTRAVVWGGSSEQLQPGDSPFSITYLIDLERDRIIAQFTKTRGPYEAIFSKGQELVSIDESVYDLASGEEVGTTVDIKFVAESCPSFSGKQSN